ncbi:MAG TPA: FecR domain-containing protein [Kofleriaceae bacterium]|nr:FecR domain-containing protein [Kofleriaceae bacterium]
MKLKGKVPVEQLDDERLTNIERKLVVAVSEMAPQRESSWSRRGLALAGVAMAMAVAGAVGWKLHAPASTPSRPTVAEAPFTLSTTDGTKVEVTHTGTRTDLAMGAGTLSLDVKHDPNRLLVVHAGDTEIEDVGTKFSVDYDGKGHVDVRVTEGEVKVKRAGKDFEVTANNAWTTEQGTITLAQLDSATTVVAQNTGANGTGDDIEIGNPKPIGETPKSGSNATTNAGSAIGSNTNGSASGSGAGSANGKHKAGATNIKKAILAVELNPLSGTMTDYIDQLKTATNDADKSRIMYSIAVQQHLQKSDGSAEHSIEGIINGRTKDEAYKDAMWLQVRITCLRAVESPTDERAREKCRVSAHRYVNNIPTGVGAGIADQILKAIANGL